LLSLYKTFISQWLYIFSTLPCHTQQSKQGRLLKVWSNDWGKIKVEEDAISEIVVADTDWEFDAKASNVDYFEEEEEEEQQQQLQASAMFNHRLQQLADYQSGDRLKEGTQIFILLSAQQKVDH